jgi:hypothetical protein
MPFQFSTNVLGWQEGQTPFHNGDKGCSGLVNRWLRAVLQLDIFNLQTQDVVGGDL